MSSTRMSIISSPLFAYLSDFRFGLLHRSPSSSISRLLIQIITGIQVAQTQTSVDPKNVDTSNDEGVRPDSHKVVTLEDTEHFIKDNRNKMKCYN
jgi:hypothetical protein